MIKKFYHFELFRKFYARLPKLLKFSKFDFEEVSFFLFLLCLAATLVAGILRCLATTYLHPSMSMFKKKAGSRIETRKNASENMGYQSE